MKKMMKYVIMIAVALGAAGSAQSAAINWGVPSNAMKDSSGNVLAGAVVLLMQVAKNGDAPVFGWSGGLTISGGNYLGKTVLNGLGKLSGTVVDITGNWTTGDINVYGGAAYGKPATVATAGYGIDKGLDYYMIVFNSDTISEGSMYATSVLLNKYSTSETGNIAAAFITATGASSTWTPVPEPTSFALVGLGAVVLALRRRFAK